MRESKAGSACPGPWAPVSEPWPGVTRGGAAGLRRCKVLTRNQNYRSSLGALGGPPLTPGKARPLSEGL